MTRDELEAVIRRQLTLLGVDRRGRDPRTTNATALQNDATQAILTAADAYADHPDAVAARRQVLADTTKRGPRHG